MLFLRLQVLKELRDITDLRDDRMYSIHWRLMNTKRVGGVPQSRDRLYIVLLQRNGEARVPFEWPEDCPSVTLASLMDRGSTRLSTYDRYPMPASKTARANIADAIKRVKDRAAREGKDPVSYNIIVDMCASKGHMMEDACPCITKARGGSLAFWSLPHGRALSASELVRLQGVDPSRTIGVLSGVEPSNGHSAPSAIKA